MIFQTSWIILYIFFDFEIPPVVDAATAQKQPFLSGALVYTDWNWTLACNQTFEAKSAATKRCVEPDSATKIQSFDYESGVTTQNLDPDSVASNRNFDPYGINLKQSIDPNNATTNQSFDADSATRIQRFESNNAARNQSFDVDSSSTSQSFDSDSAATNHNFDTDNAVKNQSFKPPSVTLYNEEQCRDQITTFVYSDSLCGVSDLQTFLKSSRKEYTCADRCGREATSGKTRECACDMKCELYSDCCRDFSDVCPEVHAQARLVYSHLMELRVTPFCKETSAVLTIPQSTDLEAENKDINTEGVSSTPRFSTTSPAGTETSSETKFTDQTPTVTPLREKTPITWWDDSPKWHYATFKIIDTTFGVVFRSFMAFRNSQSSQSKGLVVPRVASLDCLSGVPVSSLYGSYIDVLPHCQLVNVRDMKTYPQRRNCYNREMYTVACACAGETRLSTLFDACHGQHSHVTLKKLDTENATIVEHDSVNGNCVYQNNAESFFDEDDTFVETDTSMKLIFLPQFPLSLYKPANQSFGDERPSLPHADSSSLVGPLGDIEYTLILTKFRERRMRCPRFNSQLWYCQVESCIKGALLLPVSPNYLGSEVRQNKCFVPVVAEVKDDGSLGRVPICNCLRVVVAFTSLQIWVVTTNPTRLQWGSCSLQLQLVPEGRTLPRADLLSAKASEPGRFPSTLEAVEKDVQNSLDTKSPLCLEEDITGLRVCLYEREKDLATNITTKALCIKLSLDQARHISKYNSFNSCYEQFSGSEISIIVTMILNLSLYF
ncbi:hypothetical protein EGW08_011237 [Elysia chlorotica]|uniref:SMB domain-containing protein n=1 Tax=Elysia chlorotica TaxID=188477 RepID=A0A3S1BHR2_ELYCH|nr:hypothetical protein EGW08_011237 [Elysia chlorotica]